MLEMKLNEIAKYLKLQSGEFNSIGQSNKCQCSKSFCNISQTLKGIYGRFLASS